MAGDGGGGRARGERGLEREQKTWGEEMVGYHGHERAPITNTQNINLHECS